MAHGQQRRVFKDLPRGTLEWLSICNPVDDSDQRQTLLQTHNVSIRNFDGFGGSAVGAW